MTINFAQALHDLNKKEITDSETTKPLTLRTIAENALLSATQDDQANGEEKLKRWKLAQSIHGAEDGTLNLVSEDVVLIKRLVAKAYPTLVVGQVFEMLEATPAE